MAADMEETFIQVHIQVGQGKSMRFLWSNFDQLGDALFEYQVSSHQVCLTSASFMQSLLEPKRN